jgi:hypothetical protein
MAQPAIPAKGLAKHKKTLVIAGAAGLLLLLYLRSRSASSSSSTTSTNQQDAINLAAQQAALQQQQSDLATYAGSATGGTSGGGGGYYYGSSSTAIDPNTGIAYATELANAQAAVGSSPSTSQSSTPAVTNNYYTAPQPATTSMPTGPGTPASTGTGSSTATLSSVPSLLSSVKGIIAAPSGSRTTKSGYVTVGTGGSNYVYVPTSLAPSGYTIFHSLTSTTPVAGAKGLGHGLWAVPANYYR